MDPLSDLLADARASGASVRQAALCAPWRLRFDGAPLTMVTVMAGGAVVVLADGSAHRLAAGSTAVVRGPEPFHTVDDESTMDRPFRSIPVHEAPERDDAATTVLVTGAYRADRARHQRLVRTLPPALVLDEEVEDVLWLHAMRDAIARRGAPGGRAALDRVLDWGLVCTLGCWFERQGPAAPAWYRGALDPVTAPALEALHREPARDWTVAALAARSHVSRARFAKRFTEVMDQPPLRYLAEWRMSLAAEMLADPGAAVAATAKAVGYRDPFAFSTAFKRHWGASPRAFRAARG